ncbi:dual specificity phosphatase, catalytic domain-containing protein [Hirsutella rhossiliensis]|uniref:phosphatidylinositol-3,4,5-trisphosphate 3-phosphatase n=1 Tax=Hirsutella rhossiliensis TaxID=111463 RepID=A0A9P8SGG4_9HYPO|nr:dual specificity phosphatase, catalytic domain-containing protein [Hirsutella rhossiliensis]KAH0961099.1 dual specificity phosphatase, catalytic domain-containing protein [Hirsutella rhossiliensis]
MASILRQIVAGPRARHPEAGLDLCYVTDDIIATSGPSQTYPQLAYRNPLDQLVAFLDSKHGDDWAIWEFRAEGTGYPDDAVYGRIRHYPWPDHHPPPFRLVPMIMASMRNWLHGGPLEGATAARQDSSSLSPPPPAASNADGKALGAGKRGKRVVVVHCKAGKGRSGTATCSYLISEQGWKAEDALARFTERRMRPRFGAGVSIPSQLRWIGYVDRWTQNGKRYVDRAIEILEVHVWGLRNGVKVDVEGFEDHGRKIRVFHTFTKKERVVVEGDVPAGGGLGSIMWEWAGYPASAAEKAPEGVELANGANARGTPLTAAAPDRPETAPLNEKKHHMLKRKGTDLIQKVSAQGSRPTFDKRRSKTIIEPSTSAATSSSSVRTEPPDDAEPGGMAVILKPSEPIRIPTSDVNISVERRNKTPKSMGLTMVTAVAHVWFNAFFDGQGPEQGGTANDSGVFAIDWDAMDGIKGSSRKGARALDRLAVVWRAVGEGAVPGAPAGEEIVEPPEGQPVPQLQAADWAGGNAEGPEVEPDLGLRVQSPASEDVSRASSLRSAEGVPAPPRKDGGEDDGASLEGVRCSGPAGEELLNGAKGR